MTKYWGKQISHTRVSPKWVKSRRRREKKDSTMVITMASYSLQMPPRVAHTKPPGPKALVISFFKSRSMQIIAEPLSVFLLGHGRIE